MFDLPPADGDTFVLFGSDHFIAMGAIALVSIVLIIVCRAAERSPSSAAVQRGVCWFVVAVMVPSWITGQVYAITTRTWTLAGNLPLHLCDIGVFVTAAALIGAARSPGSVSDLGTRRVTVWQVLYELSYFWGMGGTLQAILTPELHTPFPDPMSIRYFLTHGGIVVGVLVMTVGLRMRPLPGSPGRVWLLTLGLALVMMLVDWLLGVNYMYLMGPPTKPSLFDFFGPWPWSLIVLLFVGTAFIVLWYSPFWIMDRLRERRAATAGN